MLVRVHAASINPFDVVVAAGCLLPMLTRPMTAGADFAGEVEAVFASIGGEVIPRSFAVMKPAGPLVTTGQMAGAEEA